MTYEVLVAEDDPLGRDTLVEALTDEGYKVHAAADGDAALRLLEMQDFDLVVTDLVMPGTDGMDVLRKAVGRCPVILITAHGSVDNAVAAMKLGAFDFVEKPINLERLSALIERALQMRTLATENEQLRERVKETASFAGMIGSTADMRAVFEQIRQVAPTDATVCIMGESGTGKELVANAIHELSRRARQPFVKVNCAAITETLLESELFGHEKGSFTGALKQRKGRFEMADGGTLLLDEIAEMSPPLQAKLLRVLQEQTFERVGGSETLRTDVRVVAATNADLQKKIAAHQFREDLYYRISVFPIALPPLRERREDIGPLVDHFLRMQAEAMHKQISGIDAQALDALLMCDWPGNVRQLQNAIERACVMVPAGGTIGLAHLPPDVAHSVPGAAPAAESAGADESSPVLPDTTMDELERMAIEQALERCGGNRSQAARALKIGVKTLYRKIEKYAIDK
jgi:DNA-binding NtrC family response regulator